MKKMKKKIKRTELSLSKGQIYGIAIFYLILFLSGIFLFISSILFPNIYIYSQNIIFLSFFGSIGSGLIGSTIYYTRKIYKSLINGNLHLATNNKIDKLRIGTFLYFVARPFISIGIALLIVLGMIASTFIMFAAEVNLTTGFQYLAMLISFFGGFSVGSFLPKLEEKGKSIANKILK